MKRKRSAAAMEVHMTSVGAAVSHMWRYAGAYPQGHTHGCGGAHKLLGAWLNMTYVKNREKGRSVQQPAHGS